jgi:hypothetical protein
MSAIMPPRPALLPVNVDGIPASMMSTPRWAPWRAVWNSKKQKYEKVPHHARQPKRGLSNKSTQGWGTFDQAMAAYLQNPKLFAGVGYLMTGPHGLVAIDLDHCVKGGEIQPWAAEVVAKLDSYTEFSPSGNGLRVMVQGAVDRDWMNHERGIEVYGGVDARFVTITGAKVPGSRAVVSAPPAGVMDNLAARWRRTGSGADIVDLHLPPLLGASDLPDIEDLDLPTHARNFLAAGADIGRDRSQALFATSIALAQAGLEPQVILSILEGNEHAMEVALDHRRQDYDKALRYLWKDHCNKGTARAGELRQLDLDQFEDFGAAPTTDAVPAQTGTSGEPSGAASADDFEDLGDDCTDLLGDPAASAPAKPAKAPRFTPMPVAQFLRRPRPDWIIKGVLPRAGLAVIYGASGSGKTFFTFDMAACVARGADWRGVKVAKGRVVYIVAEGAGGFRNRVEAYCEYHGLAPEDLDVLVIPDAPNFVDKLHRKALLDALKLVGPISVIVVDTYARVMAGANENDAKDTGDAVAYCDVLHRVTGALVVLIHHSGKDASKGARGSGALRAAADVEIEVVQTRDYRAATITKMKDGEDNKEYAFRLGEVALGQDEDGYTITSCVVEARDAVHKAERKEEPKGDVEKAVYNFLNTSADLDDTGTPLVALVEGAAALLDFDPESGKKDRRKEVVKRAIESLARKNLLVDDGFVVKLS